MSVEVAWPGLVICTWGMRQRRTPLKGICEAWDTIWPGLKIQTVSQLIRTLSFRD